MSTYILKRLLLIIPTLFFVLLINFSITQIAPGGPVEQAIQQVENFQGVNNGSAGLSTSVNRQEYRGAQGLSPDMVDKIKVQYGFDRPAHERFYLMLKNYLTFDFGTSFFKDKPVTQLLLEKMPVTISLGLWSTLIIYLISIPLGIKKAKQKGMFFDKSTSLLLAVGHAVPAFVFAVLLIVFFAGGSYFQWFPLQGFVSDNFQNLSFFSKIADYFWHMALPLLAMVLSGLASLTYLTQYSFIEEMQRQYVLAARAKGFTEKHVLYKHIFRNAILVIVAGLPQVIVGVFFVGNVLIEIIFNLDGIGLLGFEAIQQRDYPVIFGTLFFLTLFGLILRLICDVIYSLIDPRIDFESSGAK